jgi:methionyl aminopeptidase
MINLKTAHEIDLMARAGSLLASVLPPLEAACKPGVKTIELDRIADKLIRDGGATPGFLGYHGFPRSICVSINDEAVHGIPGSRKIADGDLVSLDLGLVLGGHLGQHVSGSVDGATLAQAGREDQLDRGDQAGGTVGDDQKRWAQPAGHHAVQEGFPGVGGLAGAGLEADQHRPALAGDPPGGQHRLGPRSFVHTEVRAVQEQVLEGDLRQVSDTPGVDLDLDRLADPADGGLR